MDKCRECESRNIDFVGNDDIELVEQGIEQENVEVYGICYDCGADWEL